MMKYKNMRAMGILEAVRTAVNPEAEVYMLVRIQGDTTVGELDKAQGFFSLETKDSGADPEQDEHKAEQNEHKAEQNEHKAEQKSKKTSGRKESKVDHGRVVALYQARRTVKWIADDMKVSGQTVINHLKKEGIYEPGRDKEQQ